MIVTSSGSSAPKLIAGAGRAYGLHSPFMGRRAICEGKQGIEGKTR